MADEGQPEGDKKIVHTYPLVKVNLNQIFFYAIELRAENC